MFAVNKAPQWRCSMAVLECDSEEPLEPMENKKTGI